MHPLRAVTSLVYRTRSHAIAQNDTLVKFVIHEVVTDQPRKIRLDGIKFVIEGGIFPVSIHVGFGAVDTHKKSHVSALKGFNHNFDEAIEVLRLGVVHLAVLYVADIGLNEFGNGYLNVLNAKRVSYLSGLCPVGCHGLGTEFGCRVVGIEPRLGILNVRITSCQLESSKDEEWHDEQEGEQQSRRKRRNYVFRFTPPSFQTNCFKKHNEVVVWLMKTGINARPGCAFRNFIQEHRKEMLFGFVLQERCKDTDFQNNLYLSNACKTLQNLSRVR
jgi:hypothetical protein